MSLVSPQIKRGTLQIVPNRTLNPKELVKASALLDEVRLKLKKLSSGDPELLFAYRRKVMKELSYDERSKPAVRNKVKRLKRLEQGGLCVICRLELPEKYAVLDRLVASAGYTAANTRLIHQDCDTKTQVERAYK
jgi:hypothetical protein